MMWERKGTTYGELAVGDELLSLVGELAGANVGKGLAQT
jgi:hypothetical protein